MYGAHVYAPLDVIIIIIIIKIIIIIINNNNNNNNNENFIEIYILLTYNCKSRSF